MKNILGKYKALLLLTVFILGLSSASESIVVTGFQNFWTKTCNVYPDQNLWCTYNSLITANILTGLLIVSLGYVLLVRWLKLTDLKKLILAAITFVVLSVLYYTYDQNHLQAVNETGSEYLDNGLTFFINWSKDIAIALISSLWVLLDLKKPALKKLK